MAKAIMRWVKVLSKEQADKASGHNRRTYPVPNADQEAPHPNVELVNTAERGYWELAEERIKEVVTRKVRDDQVRCMEVILTASPEFFERDANGRAVDMSQSQWLKDQLTFLEKTFGKENVLSCTLHQDEKTPHVHAVIAPITKDGRLSAKLLFNPVTMTGYQTQYAEAMKPHGLERGVEHSQAKHQPMQQLYGQQNKTAAELGLGPASAYQDVPVKRPTWKDATNLEGWEQKTTAQVNEKARAQVEAANERAEKARILALENASAKEQVGVLQKQLRTSEKLKEKNYGQFKAERSTVDTFCKRLAGGDSQPEKLVERGNHVLDRELKAVAGGREKIVGLEKKAGQAEKEGLYGRVADLRYGLIQEAQEGQNKLETALRGYKGGAERLDKLDAQQAQERKDKEQKLTDQAEKDGQAKRQKEEDVRLAEAKEREKARKEEQDRLDLVARQKAEKAEAERQKPIIRENERQEIGRRAELILKTDPHIYHPDHMSDALQRAGVEVRMVDGNRRLKLTGSENEFAGADIQIGGVPLGKALAGVMTTNNARFDKEQGTSQSTDVQIGG